MATQRTDRTGQTHGALHVLALSVHNGRQWWVRWECCGRGELLDSMVISYAVKKPPACCKACAKIPAADRPPAEPTPKPKPRPKPTVKESLSVRRQTAQAMEAARAQEGIHIPGRGWWPVLRGPMGPRHGSSWTVYERRVPGEERGARS